MAINYYNIKKWWKMLTGKSIFHVNQDIGKSFIPSSLNGYFNNLTEKVIKQPELLQSTELPLLLTEKGEGVHFPVAIFQYGLGAFDLYLQTNNSIYLEKFFQSVQWAIRNQEDSGAWCNFYYVYPDNPYGAMCQGEAASLLCRMFNHTKDNQYLNAAIRAIDFMLLPVAQGGTSQYQDDDLILLEYTHLAPVLNGWIFALFGLYDILLVTDREEYRLAFNKTIITLKRYISDFDTGYWSFYDLDRKIASPFYHKLHIAQLEALYTITNDDQFLDCKNKWIYYNTRLYNKAISFVTKAIQKIME
jgi:hypothetical protein